MLETAVGPSATTPLAITPVPPAGDETIACLGLDWEHADSTIEASKIMQIRLRLKEPADFKLIGTPHRRLDSAGKVDGSAKFGIDSRLPGMKFAVVAASPTFGGKLVSRR